MPPKKTAVTEAEAHPSELSPTDKKEKKPDATTVRKLATHPSTAIMVREAIKALDSKKGVSSQAIQNYIKQQYPSVDLVRLKGLLRKTLIKGIASGTLVRPANAAPAASGAKGRFRLPKTKELKAKSENADPNVQKAPKAEEDGAKGEPKKKKPAAKKREEKDEPSEELKPARKSKKDDVSSSKVAPVKKPKVAKAAQAEEAETVTAKPKRKAKAVTGDKTEKAGKAQKGKAAQSKAQAESEAPAKAQGKRGKKATE
uniref:H15 domain-containing protein n=1 Tax=Neogobius melanostomus TaxID=47308 RepID=A0A8C6UH76_9GOBI